MSTSIPLPAEFDKLIGEWFVSWELGPPPDNLRIEFSKRLKRSLGRCRPERPEIRLAARLLDGPTALLQEALCHELAHVATHSRFGRTVKPHGPEWKELMTRAGFEPRVHIQIDRPLSPNARKEPTVWAHRCPVCQMTRVAHRRVPQWRCASCREEGLGGELVIERASGTAVVANG